MQAYSRAHLGPKQDDSASHINQGADDEEVAVLLRDTSVRDRPVLDVC